MIEKRSYGGKLKFLRGLKNEKSVLGSQNRTFEGCFEIKMTFKNILEVPALIPAQFPYKKQLFSINFNEN